MYDFRMADIDWGASVDQQEKTLQNVTTKVCHSILWIARKKHNILKSVISCICKKIVIAFEHLPRVPSISA